MKDFNEDMLLRKFEEIHDYIYANEGLTPQQTLNEFIKVLFAKMYDENNKLGLFFISPEEYKVINNSQRNCFSNRIDELFSKTKKEYSTIFDSNEKINLTQNTLAFIVNKLHEIKLTESSKDAKGLAFQKFLSHKDKEANGQFFTPTPVIDFCVKFINPKAYETIIDPCCGSGGFLYSALNYIRENEALNLNEEIGKYIFGFDINKDIVKISKMKFLLEANINNNIEVQNSLDDADSLKVLISEKNPDCKCGIDNILTNPPFGASGKITNTSILARYKLGHKWIEKGNQYIVTNTLQSGQSSEILFVEQCLNLLKENGKMAIVLPNGHFENPSLNYLRQFIKTNAKILGIVTLPQETFIPYGTGIKTSLLFIQKKTHNFLEEDYNIFFGKITKLGYNGNKNASPTFKHDDNGNLIESNGQYVIDEDFSEVLNDYQEFLKNGFVKSNNSYSIKYSELKDRWDYNFYMPENKEFFMKFDGHSKKLSELVDIVKVKSSKLKNKAELVDYVELSDVNTKSFEIINSSKLKVFELPSRASFELKENDIITSVAGNSIGSEKHITALVNDEFQGAICTNGFRVLRNPKIDLYYLLYFFSTDMFRKQIKLYRTGAAIPTISDKDFSNILVYIPSENEITEIGDKVRLAFDLRKQSKSILNEIAI